MSAVSIVRNGKHIGVRELRQNLSKVVRNHNTYFVTEHGKPVRAVLSYDLLLELLELLEELKDRTLLKEVSLGRKEYKEGGWASSHRLKKALGM